MSLLAMRAERGALTIAPAFSGYCVLGKAIVIVAITESACVETAVNTRPAKVLGVAVCEHFYERHGPEWKPLFIHNNEKRNTSSLGPRTCTGDNVSM
jgi:hypothetical protein